MEKVELTRKIFLFVASGVLIVLPSLFLLWALILTLKGKFKSKKK